MRRIAFCLLLILATHARALADDWQGPQDRSIFNNDGTHFVRIFRGYGNAWRPLHLPISYNARAHFYALQPDRSFELIGDILLLNPVAPVDAFVANSGHLVTLDDWHNMGGGTAVAIYGPNGAFVAAYTLKDLYSQQQLDAIPRSVSSAWWRCSPVLLTRQETVLYVPEFLGGYHTFELESGKHSYHLGFAPCSPPFTPNFSCP